MFSPSTESTPTVSSENGHLAAISSCSPPIAIGSASSVIPHPLQPQIFFLLCHNGSANRHTFFPSSITLNEYIMNSHSCLNVLLMMPPTTPGSSPALIMYFAPLTITMLPSALTVDVPDV